MHAQPKIELEIRFEMDRTPREQVDTALAGVAPRPCPRHPHEVLPVDASRTITSSNELRPLRARFLASFDRCSRCGHNDMDGIGMIRCAAEECGPRLKDSDGKPLPYVQHHLCLALGETPQAQLAKWQAERERAGLQCYGTALRFCRARVELESPTVQITPHFAPCPQCGLEDLGLTPDEAWASFQNLVLDPPVLRDYLATCRAFAAQPQAVLLMLGNTGTGKTHLAVAILRERLRQDAAELVFIRARHLFAEHWRSLRPVPFAEAAPESPLARCQSASLLVLDELAPPSGNRDGEDLLLDLFEHRLGHHLPTVLTSNLTRQELELALGSRLFDRLRRAAFAVLEFGFESKRPALNADYLRRCVAGAKASPAIPPATPRVIEPRTITELRCRLDAVKAQMVAHPGDVTSYGGPPPSSEELAEFDKLHEMRRALERQIAGLQ